MSLKGPGYELQVDNWCDLFQPYCKGNLNGKKTQFLAEICCFIPAYDTLHLVEST